MNLRQALDYARSELREKKFPEYYLEGEILLRYVLGADRAYLFSYFEREIGPDKLNALKQVLTRRFSGEPVAYITGHKEFYGLDLIVNKDVLIPRPETELLVEKALELAAKRKFGTIADIGTGSGAIAVCLALKLPGANIFATDIFPAALKVAAQNAARYGVLERINFLQGDMLKPLPEKIDLIVANLPYVKASELKKGPLTHEPQMALNGGKDGLEQLRRFCRDVAGRISAGGCLLLEVGQGQAQAVCNLLEEAYPAGKLVVHHDMAGIERVVALCLTQV